MWILLIFSAFDYGPKPRDNLLRVDGGWRFKPHRWITDPTAPRFKTLQLPPMKLDPNAGASMLRENNGDFLSKSVKLLNLVAIKLNWSHSLWFETSGLHLENGHTASYPPQLYFVPTLPCKIYIINSETKIAARTASVLKEKVQSNLRISCRFISFDKSGIFSAQIWEIHKI